MNWPQVSPGFHLRQLKRRPLLLSTGSLILRSLGNHADTLPSQPRLVKHFLYAWHEWHEVKVDFREFFLIK